MVRSATQRRVSNHPECVAILRGSLRSHLRMRAGYSHREGRILLGHDHLHLLPLQFRNELVRGLLDDRERAVVARDYGLGLDEALDRDCGGDRAHGEAIANWDHRDLRLMELSD